MKEPKRSEQMSDDELFAQDLLCPDCGRHGTVAGYIPGGKYIGIELFKGLDLDHCDGCVGVLRVRGGSPFTATSPLG
jgi:hypothetical protein